MRQVVEIVGIDLVVEKEKRLRQALREMLLRFDGVDNGRCRTCGGHRLWVRRGRGMVPGRCEGESCPSSRWRGLLA